MTAPNDINYLDVKRITISPNETDTILIVDADAVLTLPIASQSLKAIPGKIINRAVDGRRAIASTFVARLGRPAEAGAGLASE